MAERIKELISAEELAKRVHELAEEIKKDYAGKPLQLVCILKGSVFFACDLAKMLDMELENHGISDSTIANLPENTPMCIRYAQMADDADIITVMGGTNDVRCGVPLGEMNDRCNTTFYGALHTLCQGLYTKYIGSADPTVGAKRRIILLTPPKLLDADKSSLPNTPENNANILYKWDKWIEVIKEVAAFYSFQVIDMYNFSGINPHLDRTVKGYEDGYFGNYNPYITDGTHPTQEGAEMMANLLTRNILNK